MKKLILIGILLSILALLLTPAIPAIEFQTVSNNIQNVFKEEQNQFSGLFEEIQSFLDEDIALDPLNSLKDIFSTNGKTIISTIINSFAKNETDPYIDSILDLIVVIIVAYIISKVLSHVFDNIFQFLKSTGSSIFVVINYILSFLVQILVFGVNSVVIILQLLSQFLLNLGELAMYLILGIVTLILTIFVIIIYGIGLGIVVIWKIIGSIVGVILDILRVIYESFFPTQLSAITQ